jgi:endonuclease YncB( thermonuclease family)
MGIGRRGTRALVAGLAALVAVAGAGAAGLPGADRRRPAGSAGSAGSESAGLVDHVVDGDTLDVRVAGRFERVRTVQIDAPESSSTRFGRPDRCGARAKAYAETLTRPGATVWLEFSGRDRTDAYGRVLALVHLAPGGETWQERMVRAGWAEVLVYRGNRTRLAGVLDSDEAYAKAHDLGVYALCAGRFHDSGG